MAWDDADNLQQNWWTYKPAKLPNGNAPNSDQTNQIKDMKPMKSLKIAPTAAILAALALPALAQEGDATKGEKVFKKCKACHMVGDGAKNKVGPLLTGILDDAAGQNPDFKYSKALQEAAEGGLVWDAENLGKFLTKPRDFLKGTKMTFPGLKKEKDVANIMAYLATFE